MERKQILVVAALSLPLTSATPVPRTDKPPSCCPLAALSWHKAQMEASHGRENQVLVELLAARE